MTTVTSNLHTGVHYSLDNVKHLLIEINGDLTKPVTADSLQTSKTSMQEEYIFVIGALLWFEIYVHIWSYADLKVFENNLIVPI